MEFDILDDFIDSQQLKSCEEQYYREVNAGVIDQTTRFNYAACLVRSKYSADVRKAVDMFKIMYEQDNTNQGKRNYLYFMALGYAKLKEYTESLKLIENFLKVEPNNKQVKDLEVAVRKRLGADGKRGVAIAAGATLAVGAVGLGLAYLFNNSKSKNSKEENK